MVLRYHVGRNWRALDRGTSLLHKEMASIFLMDFGRSNIHFNDSIIKILRFYMVWHDVPFFSSQVL